MVRRVFSPTISVMLVAVLLTGTGQECAAQTNTPAPVRLPSPTASANSPPAASTTPSAARQVGAKLASAKRPRVELQDVPQVSAVTEVQPPTPMVPGRVLQLSQTRPRQSGWLDDYRGRVLEQSTSMSDSAARRDSVPSVGDTAFDKLPSNELVWWQSTLQQTLGMGTTSVPVDVSWLVQTALESSPLVRSLLTRPDFDRTSVVIADSDFDTTAFLETKFVDTNDPIGSLLTTGDATGRFRDETWTGDAGIRRKLRGGGTLDAVQRGGFQQNNSEFLVPNPQGTTRLELNFSQPLLKDRGRTVNQIRVLLAQIDVRLTQSEVRQELENHLLKVTQGYWDLYQARSEYLQRQRLLQRTEELHSIIAGRQQVDAMTRQLLRSEASLAERRTGLRRAEATIRDAQARLRVLTGSVALTNSDTIELTPRELPTMSAIPISAQDATISALENRADIAGSLAKIRSTSAKCGVAKNQLLPRLDMLLSTYVAGLDSRRDTWGAFVNQFSDGRPSYAAGLRYEIPLGNRAARARLQRSKLEMTRAIEDFRQTTETAIAEVEIAARETKTAHDEMAARYQAVAAASREVDYLQQRYETLVDPQESAIVLIEDLLDAQQRLFDGERSYVAAQIDYAISWVRLRRSMGVLLRIENFTNVPNDEPLTLQDAGDDTATPEFFDEYQLLEDTDALPTSPVVVEQWGPR